MEENIILEENLTEENIESEVLENGEYADSNVDTGDILTDEMETEEDVPQTPQTMVVDFGGEPLPVALSDEVTTALVESLTPSGGALSSNTLDYFDRIVSGLPHDYIYVAYRTNSENSVDGVLYYSDDYVVDDDVVTFKGSEATAIRVERVQSTGYTNNTEYYNYSAEDAVVYLSRSGSDVFYTNADVGFPILGGIEKPITNTSLLGILLAVGLFVFALKLIKRTNY